MVYIKAKSDKKDKNGNVVKNGIDLFVHENSVCDSACAINQMGNYNLDEEIIRWFGIIHDLGKANPLFQSNMEGITKASENCCRHEISSVLFIDVVPEHIRDIVAMLVLSHHKSIHHTSVSGDEKVNRSIRTIVNVKDFPDYWFDKKENETLWNHINGIEQWGHDVVVFLKQHYNINATVPSVERCLEILQYYATKKFENGYSKYRGLCMMADHIASAYEDDTERIINFQKLFKTPDISFYTSKDEKYPLSLIDSDATKTHTFCIAPCGCGKTNFILKRCTSRIFYMLPFQASINAMAKRIQHDLGNGYSVGIKHASYKALDFIDDTTKELSNLFGLPVKVLTPFQAMSILFTLKGYETTIMDIKGQDVILDEIHTYSGKNMTCVLELIKVLKYLGCKIHVCTATMPSVLMKEIMSILGENDTQFVKLSKEEISSFNRHTVHTCEDIDFDEVKKRYENGEKILIVRNQIKRAIETYEIIYKEYGQDSTLLLHSQFERGRRAELENILINKFNKENKPCIVVSTQVIEVSIDINFDVMFTDCADIMSLIQRFGRINRQRTDIGVYKDVFVVNVNDGQSCLPYDPTKCKNTFEELKKIDGHILDENDIQAIIDEVHPSLENPEFKMASPLDENGRWKAELYCHTTNESIASQLDITGYIIIRKSMADIYLKTRDSRYEIPVSSHHQNKVSGLHTLSESDRDKYIYVVQDECYHEIYGLKL